MSTYQEAKLNEVNISNEYASPNATSQLGTLSTLKLLSQAKLLAQGDDNIAMIAAEEIKYLECAMKAISTNQGMKNRYGGGFSGVQELAEIIKSRQSERVYNQVMDSIIIDADEEKGNKATEGKFGLKKILDSQGYSNSIK
jgi:hypothetical protein